MIPRNARVVSILLLLAAIFSCVSVGAADAQTATSTAAADQASQLQGQIDQKTQAIQDLEAQISQYQDQIKTIESSKQTLQGQIQSLNLTAKKLAADISVTEDKISKTNYQLESLGIGITDKQAQIDQNKNAIAEGVRLIAEYDGQSFVENILASGDFIQMWNDAVQIQNVQDGFGTAIDNLNTAKADLQDQQTQAQALKKQLTQLESSLTDQKQVVAYNQQQKNTLLAQTNNSEANYQKLLQEKQAQRDAFEQELLGLESQLKLITSPSQIPPAQHGMLDWPLDSIYVTQWFGDTPFAQSNTAVYSGHGHNGVDFRASIGTPVKAAANGVVAGTGNTDTVCPNASYGKWVLITHTNGLSTIYAHLSVISVGAGQNVSTGDTIGYSGDTGYTTGPHLHFGVYATAGVEISDYKSKVCQGTYHMPIADLKAYLNPILYLPPLSAVDPSQAGSSASQQSGLSD